MNYQLADVPDFMAASSGRKTGPVLRQDDDEKEFRNMNLRLPVSTREKLEAESKATGVSPTEILRRMIENRPVGYEAPVRAAMQLALRELVIDAVSVPIDPARREKLGSVSADLGFQSQEEFLQDLVLRALADPKAAESFIFSPVRDKRPVEAAASAPSITHRRPASTTRKAA